MYNPTSLCISAVKFQDFIRVYYFWFENGNADITIIAMALVWPYLSLYRIMWCDATKTQLLISFPFFHYVNVLIQNGRGYKSCHNLEEND